MAREFSKYEKTFDKMADDSKADESKNTLDEVVRGLRALPLQPEMAPLIEKLERLNLSDAERETVALLDAMQIESQVILAQPARARVLGCLRFCRDPVKAAMILDRQDIWQHSRRQSKNLWQQLARIGGPALNDPRFPQWAVVAGGSLFSVVTGKAKSEDVDVFVKSQEDAETFQRVLLEAWGYKTTQRGECKRAVYKAKGVSFAMDVVVHPLASQPEKLVRTFDAPMCEAWASRSDGDSVSLTASAAYDWENMVCSPGRAGPLSKQRHEKLTAKGFKCLFDPPKDTFPDFKAPVAEVMDAYIKHDGAGSPYGNFLRRNLLFPWSARALCEGPQRDPTFAILTNWVEVNSDPGMTRVYFMRRLRLLGFQFDDVALVKPHHHVADPASCWPAKPDMMSQVRLLLVCVNNSWLATCIEARQVPRDSGVYFSEKA